ncbi:sensor histidine kinase [Metabacillus sp. RGM 3146]|uniref:sensor histidine kinase n=1 Tax=Metabacillus sp. RGM 3146 TaxID=3401092 RepID=UPI003B9B1223
MFSSLRWKLTKAYTIWFLLTFTAILLILFFVFRSILFSIESKELQDLLENEKAAYTDGSVVQEQPYSYYTSFFIPESGKIKIFKKEERLTPAFLHYSKNARKNLEMADLQSADGKKLHVIYGKIPIIENGKKKGELFVVKDISHVHEQTERWFFILFLIGLITGSVSLLIGSKLAGRAIEPVKENYERQKKFVSDASHELRTPLSIFSASLQVMEEEEKERLSPFSAEVLKDLKDEMKHMNSLITNLLTLAKSDSDSISIEKAVFSFSEMTSSVIHQYQMKEKGLRKFRLEGPDDDPCMAETDKTRVKELLYIFLDNAVKYTAKDGEITLRYEPDHRSKHLVIHIIDNGIGISEEDMPFIYDRFFRAEKGRSKKLGGSGLGLSIASGLLHSLDGKIDVNSTPGNGTDFTISLPVLI